MVSGPVGRGIQHYAIVRSTSDIIMIALAQFQDVDGRTPAHHAVLLDDVPCLRALRKYSGWLLNF